MKLTIYCSDGVEMSVDLMEQAAEEITEAIEDREEEHGDITGWVKYVPQTKVLCAGDDKLETTVPCDPLLDAIWALIEEHAPTPTLDDLDALEELATWTDEHDAAKLASCFINHYKSVTDALAAYDEVCLMQGTVRDAVEEYAETRKDQFAHELKAGSRLLGRDYSDELDSFIQHLLWHVDFEKLNDTWGLSYWSFTFNGKTYTVTSES